MSILGLAANQRTGLTLAELEEFVKRARQVGGTDSDLLKVTVNMRGRPRTIRLVPVDGREA